MRRLGAVFAAVCGLAGCTSGVSFEAQWRMDHPPPPEKRSIAAMQGEAEDLFRQEGYEIVTRKSVLPLPHRGVTDLTFNLRKEGENHVRTVECIVEKPCRIFTREDHARP